MYVYTSACISCLELHKVSSENTFYREHILYRTHSIENTLYKEHILHRTHPIENAFLHHTCLELQQVRSEVARSTELHYCAHMTEDQRENPPRERKRAVIRSFQGIESILSL